MSCTSAESRNMKAIADNVWIADTTIPRGRIQLPVRMTVIRLTERIVFALRPAEVPA